jgi:hypothetical protein
MFAKALNLMALDVPEVPQPRPDLTSRHIDEWVDRWRTDNAAASRLRALDEFIDQTAPKALLDVEVGDESLSMMLQQRVFRALAADLSEDAPNLALVRSRLRGLRLLSRLARRRLHKVVMAIDADVFRELSPGSSVESAVEKRLGKFIDRLRAGHGVRNEIEQKLHDLTNGTNGEDTFIIYVPPRKAQAKGIETFAIDRKGIVTLGEHSAVQAKVDELSRDYRGLWRLILFADPEATTDFVVLSRVCDEFVKMLWPGLSLGQDSAVQAIRTASWFYYVHPADQEAYTMCVRLLQALSIDSVKDGLELPDALDWAPFEDVRIGAALTHGAKRTAREHADRATLVYCLRRRDASAEEHIAMQRRFADKSFSQYVDEQIARPALAANVARTGGKNPRTRTDDEWTETRSRALTIQGIAEGKPTDPHLSLVT